MDCPSCMSPETETQSTRRSGHAVVRARRCEACESTWLTQECVVSGSLATRGYRRLPVATRSKTPPDPPSDLFLGSGSAPSPEPDQKIEGKQDRVERLPQDFVEFWGLYPHKVGKADAVRAWKRRKPPMDKVRAALGWQTKTRRWAVEKIIPNPATWLNRESWEDEPWSEAKPNGQRLIPPPERKW